MVDVETDAEFIERLKHELRYELYNDDYDRLFAAAAPAMAEEIKRLRAARDECERQFQAKVQEIIDRDNTIEALRALNAELVEALHHMQHCRWCGEDRWENCEGGVAALAAIAKAEGR